MGNIQGNTNPRIEDPKTTSFSSEETNIKLNTATTTSTNSHLTPFSREKLKSVLKEPQEKKYDSTTSELSPRSVTGNYELNPNKRNDKDPS